ncbi:hypothetical protein V8C86DRAFT_3129698 [Haematococcus lacustris]
MADGFFEMLASDLRLLADEAKRAEGIGYHLVSMFSSSDHPNIVESCDRAQAKLRALSLAGSGRSMESIRSTPELLRPFINACQFKNGRLVSLALSSFQKFAANKGVNAIGRGEIISALSLSEKVKDETTALRALQTVLTLMQDPTYCDDEAGVGQLLTLAFRIHAHAQPRSSFLHSAQSTIKQAVSLVFDHALLPAHQGCGAPSRPGSAQPSHTDALSRHAGMLGREVVAVSLLSDLLRFCALGDQHRQGASPAVGTWLRCSPPPRGFLLELLHSTLTQQASVFVHILQLSSDMRMQVCPVLEKLLSSAVDPQLDPNSIADARMVIRCAAAVLSKHVALAPDRCATMMQTLLRGLSPRAAAWQRIAVLLSLRGMLADPSLVYRLYRTFDQAPPSQFGGLRALSALLTACADACRDFLRLAADSEEDLVTSLALLYDKKQHGREFDVEQHCREGVFGGAEVLVPYLALDSVLHFAGSLEDLTNSLLLAGNGSGAAGGAAAGKAPGPAANAAMAAEGPSPALAEPGRASPCSQQPPTPALPEQGGVGRRRDSLNPPPAAPLTRSGSPVAPGPRTGMGSSVRPAAADELGPPVELVPQSLEAGVLQALVGDVWQPVQATLSSLLTKAQADSLVTVLLQGFHHMTYAAGMLRVDAVRNQLLSSLCEFSLTGPEDAGLLQHKQLAAKVPQPSAPETLVNIATHEGREGLALDPKNLAACKALFQLAHKLSDSLGPAWLYVLDVVYCLDRLLPSPYTTITTDTCNGHTPYSSSWAIEIDHPGRPHLPGSGGSGGGSNITPTLTGASLLLSAPGGSGGAALSPPGGPGPAALGPPAASPASEQAMLAASVAGLFESSSAMGSEAVVALVEGLGDVSDVTLTQATASTVKGKPEVKLHMLARMVEVLLYNPGRIQHLWPIFLEHIFRAVDAADTEVRKAAMVLLDHTVTGALDPRLQPSPPPPASSSPAPPNHTKASATTRTADRLASGSEAAREAATPGTQPPAKPGPGPVSKEELQNMVLVALEGLYNQRKALDVRRGVLRTVHHVLQHHGEELTRGWVPILRLLEAAAGHQDMDIIKQSFQSVELLCSDFLHRLDKDYIQMTLRALALFAKQNVIVNVSLTALTMLWNVADVLAASVRGTGPSISKSCPEAGQLLGTAGAAGAAGTAGAAGAAGAAGVGSPAGAEELSGRGDVSEQESVDMLMIALRVLLPPSSPSSSSSPASPSSTASGMWLWHCLKEVGKDQRPEVRNSAVRTLFLAMFAHAAAFPPATLKECMHDMLFQLLVFLHDKSVTSSAAELGASTLGKYKGRCEAKHDLNS